MEYFSNNTSPFINTYSCIGYDRPHIMKRRYAINTLHIVHVVAWLGRPTALLMELTVDMEGELGGILLCARRMPSQEGLRAKRKGNIL